MSDNEEPQEAEPMEAEDNSVSSINNYFWLCFRNIFFIIPAVVNRNRESKHNNIRLLRNHNRRKQNIIEGGIKT